ncbi:hypothetical protein OPT61_g1636 [Boeremia exigua]|uniref:Uncharacterized protein n=1 Tax=Boeremia exigua TaxID=749465 RepID=A0ACC2IPC8_9PLEO|nr:hypothetical protein OPT61_g1636 [Boeremia exigua]
MSGVLCVWAANIPESSEQWYEDEYIPEMTTKLAQHTLHCEVVEVGLDDEADGVGEREAPWKWLTVYEMEDAAKATEATYDKSNHAEMTGPLAQARFDVRTYDEVKRWQHKDWDGNHEDVVSVAVMEWQIKGDNEKEIIEHYQKDAVSTIVSSPDVLRFRVFKVRNATVLKADSYQTLERKALHTYLTLVELAIEEWPWDVVVELGNKPKWREYWEGQKAVRWQSSHYVVKRSYPDPDEGGSEE